MIDRISNSFSLRVTLVLYVIIPLMLAVGIISYVGLRMYESHIESRMQGDIELVARTMELTVGRAIAQDRLGVISESLASAFTLHGVYGAYVYDSEGRLIASHGTTADQPDEDMLSEMTQLGERQGEYEEMAGQPVFSYFVPLTDAWGQPNGMLQLTRHASDIQQSIATLRWQGAGIIAAAVIILVFLVLMGHHGAVGRYLSRLGKSMDRVKAGDRAHRAPEKGPKEIARLGNTLNTMLDSIEVAQQEIRERRATQEDLEKQLQHAEKLAAIGQLSAGVAHELGTPLSIVDGKAQRLLRKAETERQTNGLEDIRSEVRRMERIVRQLLDFGRRPSLQKRSIRPGQLVEMAIGGLREEAAQRDVRLEYEHYPDCGDVEADPVLFERALANLIGNAIEATPGGHVRVGIRCDEQATYFQIDDDGPGIEDEIGHRIFEPFFTTKQVGEGTGLGLAVVHGIVEEHGAEVYLQKSKLGGTRFTIELPLRLDSEPVSSANF